jgi:hypothetical protein
MAVLGGTPMDTEEEKRVPEESVKEPHRLRLHAEEAVVLVPCFIVYCRITHVVPSVLVVIIKQPLAEDAQKVKAPLCRQKAVHPLIMI